MTKAFSAGQLSKMAPRKTMAMGLKRGGKVKKHAKPKVKFAPPSSDTEMPAADTMANAETGGEAPMRRGGRAKKC